MQNTPLWPFSLLFAPRFFTTFADKTTRQPPAVQDIEFTPQEKQDWEKFSQWFKKQFGQDLKTEAVLLLIGMKEVGLLRKDLPKEDKVDLMHVGTCAILPDYYKKIAVDPNGWPKYELTQPLPFLDLFAQINFIRLMTLRYFQREYGNQLWQTE